MRNKGRSQYRFPDNPKEKQFAEEWENMNTDGPCPGRHVFLWGTGTLDYLLAKDPNCPRNEVTKRDREVAATVIQWLGSPVGQGFLRNVEERGD